jgi:hypothetical protein
MDHQLIERCLTAAEVLLTAVGCYLLAAEGLRKEKDLSNLHETLKALQHPALSRLVFLDEGLEVRPGDQDLEGTLHRVLIRQNRRQIRLGIGLTILALILHLAGPFIG